MPLALSINRIELTSGTRSFFFYRNDEGRGWLGTDHILSGLVSNKEGLRYDEPIGTFNRRFINRTTSK